VIDVEQRALRSFEHDALALADRLIDDLGGVGQQRDEPRRRGCQLLQNGIGGRHFAPQVLDRRRPSVERGTDSLSEANGIA